MILLIIHAPAFWKWVIAPFVIFLVEKIFRVLSAMMGQGKSFVIKAKTLPSRYVIHDIIEAGSVLPETLRRGPYAVVDRAERAKTPSSLVQIMKCYSVTFPRIMTLVLMKCYSVTFPPDLDPSTLEALLRHFFPEFGP